MQVSIVPNINLFMLMLVTTCSLNVHAHKLFESLGSAYVNKLSFRDMWGFVGQKGIDGYSPFEEVCISHELDIICCVAVSFNVALYEMHRQRWSFK